MSAVQRIATEPSVEAESAQCAQAATHGDGEERDKTGHSRRLAGDRKLTQMSNARDTSPDATPAPRPTRRVVRVVVWAGVILVTGVLVFVGYLAWPVVFPAPAGQSGQGVVAGYPLSVEATGEDGRTRTLTVTGPDGEEVALDALEPGDRIVVSGSGFDASVGIYVAICAIPESPDLRPGPCLGGVPSTGDGQDDGSRAIEWAPANWVNDDWAWKLFGARGFDDAETGEFTAYIEVVGSSDEYVDCRVVDCGVFTRNDHTAIGNRMQDLYLPVAFSR